MDFEPLDKILIIEIVAKDILIFDKVYKSCVVKVANRELVVDLLLLGFQSFDVILGMGWLTAYHASLNCFHKIITFNPPNVKFYFCK